MGGGEGSFKLEGLENFSKINNCGTIIRYSRVVLMERKLCKKELGYQIWAVASVRVANLVQINFHDIDDVIR